MILRLVGFVCLVFISCTSLPCSEEKDAKAMSLSGTIIRLYRDKNNHLVETFDYLVYGKEKSSTLLRNERSLAFDQIKPGDSIVKASGSLKLIVVRDGSIAKEFDLDYGCEE